MSSQEYEQRVDELKSSSQIHAAGFPSRAKIRNPHEDWDSKLKTAVELLKKPAIFGIVGSPGRGKSALGFRIAEAFSQKSPSSSLKYITAPMLYARIRSTNQSAAKETEYDVIEAMNRFGLLVIDEAGMGKGTDFERQTLNVIACKRYDDERPTVIISAGSEDEFNALLDAATHSRMSQCGGLIVCDWESFRK